MEVSIVDWNKLDVNEIAALLFEALQSSGDYRSEKRTVEKLVLHTNGIKMENPWSAAVAYSDGRFVGLIGLEPVGTTNVRSNPWLLGHPILSPHTDKMKCSRNLFDAIREWCAANKIESLTLGIDNSSYAGDDRYGFSTEWYLENGFTIRESDIYMGFDLSVYEPEVPVFPQGYSMIPILEADKEALYRCFYETFEHGQSPFFYDMSDKERREYFVNTTTTESVKQESSIALTKDRNIVGFSFARPFGTPRNYLVEWIGVHPDHRQLGLGKYLMAHIANIAKQEEYTTMSLSCATGNSQGYSLYTSLGWYDDGGETILSMKIG